VEAKPVSKTEEHPVAAATAEVDTEMKKVE